MRKERGPLDGDVKIYRVRYRAGEKTGSERIWAVHMESLEHEYRFYVEGNDPYPLVVIPRGVVRRIDIMEDG